MWLKDQVAGEESEKRDKQTYLCVLKSQKATARWLSFCLFSSLTFLLVGCDDSGDSDSDNTLPQASLPGVYTGVFPCQGCPGIASTLWLRSDGRFFFRQTYAADESREAFDAFSLGIWQSIIDDRSIELSGVGPTRTFMSLDTDTLVMRTDSELEHRLVRDPGAPRFSATIRLAGLMRVQVDSVLFTECLTGLVATVSKAGDYSRFWHQYRSAGRSNEPTFVEFEGRYTWSGDGSPELLTIERFITVKADGAC